MTDGFANPMAAGGLMVIPFFRSPDYVPGVSGWTVNIDGSAEFDNLTLRGTFAGTDWEFTAAGAFFYNGPAAANNLITSVAAAAGTDAFGNTYLPGTVSYTQAAATGSYVAAQLQSGSLQFWVSSGDQSGTYTQTAAIVNPAAALSGALVIQSATTVQVLSASDTNTWDTAHLNITLEGDTTVNSTTPATISGATSGTLSMPVAAGATYHFRFFLMLVSTHTGGAPGLFRLEGPGVTNCNYVYDFLGSSALAGAGQVDESYYSGTLNQEMSVSGGTMVTGQ